MCAAMDATTAAAAATAAAMRTRPCELGHPWGAGDRVVDALPLPSAVEAVAGRGRLVTRLCRGGRRAAGRAGTGRGTSGALKGAAGSGAAPESGAAPWQVLTGRYRCTGPERRTISSKVTGGLFWVHLPCDRAPTARMSSRYLPWPLIPAYLPVPLRSV